MPIYDELSRYSVIEPVMQSRAQQTLPNAAQPSSGQSSTAPNASVAPHASVAPNDERPYGVQEVVGGFTSVDLDVKAGMSTSAPPARPCKMAILPPPMRP